MAEPIAIISPVPGMAQIFKDAMEEQGLNFPVYILSTVQAEEKAKKCIREGVRVIISRGGTANYLRQRLSIPIIDTRYSFLSVLVSVRRARQIVGGEVAVVGFSGICDMVRRYNLEMEDNVLVEQVRSADDFYDAVLRARDRGARICMGGLQVQDACRRSGLRYISTKPDISEVRQALDEAIYNVHIEEEREMQFGMTSAILANISDGVVGADLEGNILHINSVAEKILRYREGNRIQDVLHDDKALSAAAKGRGLINELSLSESAPVIYRSQPIRRGAEVTGVVVTLQEADTVRAMDTRIRKYQIGKGHVARTRFEDILGKTPVIEETKNTARKFARSDSTILITGETGTGKEMFAQSIHNYSARRDAPFVAINCATLPQDLLESELFGYVRGAFTGARAEGKAGMFELAHTGTIFLDEISETTPNVQAKLLRVLQEKEVTRIGDDKVVPVDVRILAASNQDLYKAVESGRFRADLFYRICVLELRLPPLRERKEDIGVLLDAFLNSSLTLSPQAREYLEDFYWEGNVRQLMNVTQRLNVLCQDRIISKRDARITASAMERGEPVGRVCSPSREWDMQYNGSEPLLPQMERELIRKVLERTGGNREKAAAMLGISTSTLWRKTKDL